ncbi:hypothetical protein T02_14253, partial [Trichinella nativa]
LLHKMKTAMNTTDAYCPNKANTIWSLNIIFGIIAFISNVCLLAVVLRERQIKRTQKLVAAYAVGCAISGAGFAAAFIRRITIICKQNYIMPLECMYKTPHLTLYAIGESLTSLCVFFMSIDRLVAIIYSNKIKQWKKYLTNRLLVLTVILTSADVLWAWMSAWQKGNRLILALCYRAQVVSSTYYVTHFLWSSILGYVTLILYSFTIAFLRKKRSTSSGIRSIQLKREALISKRIMIIVFFTFILQNVPTSLRLYAMFTHHVFFVPDQLWCVHCINLSIYAIYYIAISLNIKKFLMKIRFLSKSSKTQHFSSGITMKIFSLQENIVKPKRSTIKG